MACDLNDPLIRGWAIDLGFEQLGEPYPSIIPRQNASCHIMIEQNQIPENTKYNYSTGIPLMKFDDQVSCFG